VFLTIREELREYDAVKKEYNEIMDLISVK